MVIGHSSMADFLAGSFGKYHDDLAGLRKIHAHICYLSEPLSRLVSKSDKGLNLEEMFLELATLDREENTHYLKICGGLFSFVGSSCLNDTERRNTENCLKALRMQVESYLQENFGLEVRAGCVALSKHILQIAVSADGLQKELISTVVGGNCHPQER